MSFIDKLVEDILKREGGYVNHPDDKGGPTNFGITQRTLSSWEDRKVTALEVKNMRKATAKRIYTYNYFYTPQINIIPRELQGQVFDCSINHGSRRAIKLLQDTLKNSGYPVSVDGILGLQSAQACRDAVKNSGSDLSNMLVDTRVAFYNRIVEKNPSQHVFLKGWLRRANEFRR
jgi:lysozyme family protein